MHHPKPLLSNPHQLSQVRHIITPWEDLDEIDAHPWFNCSAVESGDYGVRVVVQWFVI